MVEHIATSTFIECVQLSKGNAFASEFASIARILKPKRNAISQSQYYPIQVLNNISNVPHAVHL